MNPLTFLRQTHWTTTPAWLMDGGSTIGSQSNRASLPCYHAQMEDDAVLHSKNKLLQVAKALKPFVEKCEIISRPYESEQDTLGYRCKCSFQLLQEENQFQYAMRQNGEAVALGSSIFPIANRRIQIAMGGLMEKVLNVEGRKYENIANKGLASLTFAASWNDEPCENSEVFQSHQDCILTLNYNAAIENEDCWLKEAKEVCKLLSLSQVHGRSRKRLLSAVSESSLGSCLRDTIYLTTGNGMWKVSLQQETSTAASLFPVSYQKPEVAFFHPNASVMCQALEWMLGRVESIKATSSPSCRLLEMYCGCGAHTLALAKSGMFSYILAVEMDQRLVDACKINIDLNAKGGVMTPVQVIRSDAGEWAQQYHKRKKSGSDDHSFDVLLVDPPRQGLDNKVIDLAVRVESIQHVLIISCGHEALLRNLRVLCNHFEVIDCEQLDLFPRTDSVETLVHLHRKTPEQSLMPEARDLLASGATADWRGY